MAVVGGHIGGEDKQRYGQSGVQINITVWTNISIVKYPLKNMLYF